MKMPQRISMTLVSLCTTSLGFQLSHSFHLPFRSPPARPNLLHRCYARSVKRPRKNKVPEYTPSTLEWEKFEFSSSPKWDKRFEASAQVLASNKEELQKIVQEEAQEDERLAKELQYRQSTLHSLSPDLVKQAIIALTPWVKTERMERMKKVFSQRTRHTRFLFENPLNPSNVWACLRTIDSFGIQYVDVVIQSDKYKGKAALSQKRGLRTAMGSAQWLTVHNHLSTADAVAALRAEGYRIYASDLNPSSRDIRDISWSHNNGSGDVSAQKPGESPICIVMGNENDGISDEMRDLADETFTLPMNGFAESFNLSVATAITLAHLSAASRNNNGPIRPGNLSQEERDRFMLKGMINSFAKKRTAISLLKREGIVLPSNIDW